MPQAMQACFCTHTDPQRVHQTLWHAHGMVCLASVSLHPQCQPQILNLQVFMSDEWGTAWQLGATWEQLRSPQLFSCKKKTYLLGVYGTPAVSQLVIFRLMDSRGTLRCVASWSYVLLTEAACANLFFTWMLSLAISSTPGCRFHHLNAAVCNGLLSSTCTIDAALQQCCALPSEVAASLCERVQRGAQSPALVS